MSDEALPVIRPLMWKESLKSDHTFSGGVLPLKADWIIAQRGPTNCHWGAYKHVYDVQKDEMRWAPLQGSFETVQLAQEAVKAFIGSCQPVYLDEAGNVING